MTPLLTVLSIGSWLGGLDPAWIALFGTLMGGVGLKALEHWLSRGKVKQTEQDRLRDELRQEITNLKSENNQLEKDVDHWRKEYYDLRDKWSELSTELAIYKSQNPPK